jgi:hypothetical protein
MFSIISIVLFIMAIYLMNKTFIGFQPGSNKINSDVARFRDLAAKWKPELVPWSYEETELFSLTEVNKVHKRGFGRSNEAIVQSIYHEPMLYYYYKEYPATQTNAVLFAQTARYEIVYRIRAKGTQVFVNEVFTGTIEPSGLFSHPEKQIVIGKIDRSRAYRYAIYVGEREVGSFMIPTERSSISQRAFEMDLKLEVEDHLLFMIQAIYEVVMFLNRPKESGKD